MKIYCIDNSEYYEITANKRGENAMPCPVCNDDRKHKNRKSFSWNTDTNVGKCHNCDAKFKLPYERPTKVYAVPEPINNTGLLQKHVDYFTGRMISKDTVNLMKIYSEGDWFCFPYYRNNKLINVKYRTADKQFRVVKDAELILWNVDCLNDTPDYCIITEGEFDALSFIQQGFKYTLSVPNGAKGSNLTYLDPVIDLLEKVGKIYIAADCDPKGIELRDELVRRLGAEKCYVVEYEGYKDANELLQQKGGLNLSNSINNARPAKVEGLVDISEHYKDLIELWKGGLKKGATIGFDAIDDLISWELGRLAVVTGIPSHGKSEFVDYIVCKLNVLYGWKVAYYSPENHPMKYHLMKLIPKISGKSFTPSGINQEEIDDTFQYIEDNFQFIAPDDNQTFERIIELAKITVKRNGVKILVIDPYNKIEHNRDRNESETEYISRFLDQLSTFCRINGVLCFLVAHPRKMSKEMGSKKLERPNLYDINGSANFFNKCDFGLTVYRDFEKKLTTIDVQKVKFQHLGGQGEVDIMYNYVNGRYEVCGTPIHTWSNKNWIYTDEPNIPAVMQPNENFLSNTDECPF